MTLTARLCTVLAIALLSACTANIDMRPKTSTATEATPALSKPLAGAAQVIVVTTPTWDSPVGTLRRYERKGSHWQNLAPAHGVSLGRNGSAWGLGLHPLPQPGPQKREGDGRSPAGVFALSSAFGYAAQQPTAMTYQPMQASDYCIDVPGSPLYNRIVDSAHEAPADVAGSTEPMRLDLHNQGDPRYALGIVVDHNPQAIPGMGSCIFMHLWRQVDEATAGCTAMPEAAMRALLDWLDPAQHPVLVLLPESEYARLAEAWQLPSLEPRR